MLASTANPHAPTTPGPAARTLYLRRLKLAKGLTDGPVACSLAMGRPTPASIVRAVALTAVLGYVAFSVSGVRYLDPELREATRSAALARADHVPVARSHKASRVEVGPAPIDKAHAAQLAPPRQRFPRCLSSCMAAGLPPGADALGVSVPKRLRWAVIGGHGRHGAG